MLIYSHCNFWILHMWNCINTGVGCAGQRPMFNPRVLTSALGHVWTSVEERCSFYDIRMTWKTSTRSENKQGKTELTLWQQHLMSHRVAKGDILLYKTVIFNSLEFIRYAKGAVTHLTIGVTSLLTAERCWKPLWIHFGTKQQIDAY